MLKSFKFKILFMPISLVLSITICFVFFFKKEMLSAMIELNESTAKNALKFAMITLENEYKNLEFFKEKSIEARKKHLKEICEITNTNISNLYNEWKLGMISENEAKEKAKDHLKKVQSGKNTNFWLADYNYNIQFFLNETFTENQTFRDIKGNQVIETIIDNAKKYGTGFFTYCSVDGKDISPKETISYYYAIPEWKWVLGINANIYDIEQEVLSRKNRILKIMRYTLAKLTIGKKGYMYIFNSDSFLVHPNLEGKGGAKKLNPVTGNYIVDELIKASQTPDKPFEYLWDAPEHKNEFHFWKESYVMFFEPAGWYIGSSVYKEDIHAPVNMLRNKLLTVSLIFFLLSILASLYFSNIITLPITKLVSHIEKLSHLDLTAQLDIESSATEFKDLTNYLNTMLKEFTEVVLFVKTKGHQLRSSVDKITEIKENLIINSKSIKQPAENLTGSSEQISINLNKIVAKSEQMSDHVNTISNTASYLSKNINLVSSSIVKMSETMMEVRKNSQNGSEISHEAMKNIEEAWKIIHKLGESADEISDVTDMIKRIAEMTNILALNATIEAASAGEAGDGFAVVASSIQQFADQSTRAAEEIASRINDILEKMKNSQLAMDDVSKVIKKMHKTSQIISKDVEEKSKTAELIAANAGQANFHSHNIASSMEQFTNSTKEISKNVVTTALEADGLGNNIDIIQSSTKKITQYIGSIQNTVNQVNKHASELEEMVARFKL